MQRPETIPSFGPNGTHWPNFKPTPFLYDDSIPHKITVDCNWGAIATAINNLTDQQVDEGVLILVKNGTLVGKGSGNSHQSVLKNVGKLSWNKRVTVAPLNGYGAVNISNGAKVVFINNVCFAGFKNAGFYMVTCQYTALAWCVSTGYLGTSALLGDNSYNEFVEVAQPNSATKNGDKFNVFAGRDSHSNIKLEACYITPNYYEKRLENAGANKPHTDSLQYANAGGKSVKNVSIIDSVIISSNNCAVQTGSTDTIHVKHSALLGGNLSHALFPPNADAALGGYKSAMNGGGNNHIVEDSILQGPITISVRNGNPFAKVVNSFASQDYQYINEGKFTKKTLSVDEARQYIPRLDNLWSRDGAPIVDQPDPIEPDPEPNPDDSDTPSVQRYFSSNKAESYVFEVTVNDIDTDLVLGLTSELHTEFTSSSYQDLAAIIRFKDGKIESYDSNQYSSDGEFTYSTNTTYKVEFVPDEITYSVYLDGDLIADNYGYRTNVSGEVFYDVIEVSVTPAEVTNLTVKDEPIEEKPGDPLEVLENYALDALKGDDSEDALFHIRALKRLLNPSSNQ